MNSLIILHRFLPRMCGLTLLVGVNIALTTFCWMPPALLRGTNWGALLEGCAIVLTLSQAVLLGVWLSWSDVAVPYRWAMIAAPTAALVLAAKWYVGAMQQTPSDAFVAGVMSIPASLLAVHAALLPLRWLCGWRLTFSDGLLTAVRRGQFTIRQWFLWCVALALPPAWFSLVWGEPPSSAIGLVVILLYTMPLLAAALPAAFSHRWWLWTPLAVGWTVPIGVAIAELRWQYLCSVGAGLAVFRTQLLLLWVAIPAGFATAFVVNLLLLRALGLRWIGASSAPAGIPASDLRGCPPLPGNRC